MDYKYFGSAEDLLRFVSFMLADKRTQDDRKLVDKLKEHVGNMLTTDDSTDVGLRIVAHSVNILTECLNRFTKKKVLRTILEVFKRSIAFRALLPTPFS